MQSLATTTARAPTDSATHGDASASHRATSTVAARAPLPILPSLPRPRRAATHRWHALGARTHRRQIARRSHHHRRWPVAPQPPCHPRVLQPVHWLGGPAHLPHRDELQLVRILWALIRAPEAAQDALVGPLLCAAGCRALARHSRPRAGRDARRGRASILRAQSRAVRPAEPRLSQAARRRRRRDGRARHRAAKRGRSQLPPLLRAERPRRYLAR